MDEPTADLPYVDGSAASAEELRETVAREVAWESDPRRHEVDEARASLAATTDELARRLDVHVATARRRSLFALFGAAALLAFVAVRRWRKPARR